VRARHRLLELGYVLLAFGIHDDEHKELREDSIFRRRFFAKVGGVDLLQSGARPMIRFRSSSFGGRVRGALLAIGAEVLIGASLVITLASTESAIGDLQPDRILLADSA
jgi:hypothetical protein